MKIQYLEEFISLATTLSYTKVAQKHRISTSVLSKHIKALEEKLGEVLFYRSTARVELTPVGHRYLEGIFPIVEQYNKFLDDFKMGCTSTGKSLQIILGKSYPPLLFAAMIAKEQLKKEQIDIDYLMPQHSNYYDALEHSGGDAVITFSSASMPSRYEVFPLYNDPFVALVPLDHPLASHEQISLTEDLSKHRIISLKGMYFRANEDTVTEAFRAYDIKPTTSLTLTSTLDALNLFANLKDVLIVPQNALPQLHSLSERGYKLLSFKEELFYKLALIYLPENYSETLIRFATVLKHTLNDDSP